MLYKYREAFSLRDEIDTCPNIEVEINVTDKSPFFITPYQVREKDKAFIDKEMKQLCYCYVMQAVVSVSCLGNRSLSHAKLMSTALTQLLIFRFSCLLTNKGIVQCIDNSN